MNTRPLTGTVAPEGELEQAANPVAEDAAADLAKLGAKYNINSTSAFGQQILKNLQMSCEEFISTFRKASIRGEFPEESLERTVGEALNAGGKLRKLLVDSRFAK